MERPLQEMLNEARALRRAGKPAEAALLIEGVKAPGDAPCEARELHLESQCAYRQWAESSALPRDPFFTRLFFRAQSAFYRSVYIDPVYAPSYLEQASLWQRMGDPGMARRLLRSLNHVNPAEELAEALTGIPEEAAAATAVPEPAPELEAIPPAFRVLVLVIPGYDPGMDVLYDGLCEVLGADNVEEYPWKPMLHGAAVEEADGYPTPCNRPGTPRDLGWVCEALCAGHFNAVLYADIIQSLPRDEVRAIVQASQASRTPLFVVDGWDDAADNQPLLLEHLGLAALPLYFKREMLRCHDYGPNVRPLPLSYGDARIPAEPESHRTQMLFWAGNRYYGLRRLYLGYLETSLNVTFEAHYPQEAYVQMLRSSLIAVSFCGFGYDTVRYWEAPAHGAMLLAEHPPIRIPHDFEDGKTALFFDDLPELEEKLLWCMQHPQEAARIAFAGHAHFKRYHTASARARQLLAHICTVRRRESE